jgi:Family of unknown function (DUF5906)
MTSDEKLSLEAAQKQSSEVTGSDDNPEHNYSAAPQSDTPQSLYESESLMIADFNRYFIQVLNDNLPQVIWERESGYTIFTYENFHKQFSYAQVTTNDLFSENKKRTSNLRATKLWVDSPRKRKCLGIKFWPSTTAVDPEDPDNKLFNTWRGWPTKPVWNLEKWKIIHRYIHVVICNRDCEKTRHLLDYYAHLFQKPEQKPSFGIALRGEEEGTGKSMFFEEMKKIVGRDNSFTTADPERIFGNNNPGMNCCLQLHLEEVEWALYRRYANKLRDLFTRKILNVNNKWEKQIEQNNFTRIGITGNAEHIMQVSRTGRRLSIFDVAPIKIDDPEYFRVLAETFDTGGREALMCRLLNRDISKFNPYKPLHTKETDEQKELSMDDVSKFWLEEMIEGAKLPYDEVIKTVDDKIICYRVIVEKLVWCFNEWQKLRGERPISAKAFGKRFRKLVPDMPPAHNVKVTPADMKKQFNCFEVPNIDKCREHFAAHQRLKHKTWEKAEKFEMLGIDLLKWYKGW